MKKYRLLFCIIFVLIALCISVCFIPINASKMIPAIEKQVNQELGVQIHIEKLILRLGPSIKIKAPVMHIMYEDGQKFGQFNNVKFFISWSSLFNKKSISIKRVYANRFIIKVNSNDKYLSNILSNLLKRPFDETPDFNLKNYSITYIDKNIDKKYKIVGHDFMLAKLPSFDNFKTKAIGEFYINDKKHINYDVSLVPNVKYSFKDSKQDYGSLIDKVEKLDLQADIITDLKLYNNINGDLQASGLVNIDNISVLDPMKKAPKSFVYLTFWGSNTGVLSNIYADNDKKICIDGVINHSAKSSVNLKVKTDEVNLSELYNKVQLLADITKIGHITNLKGLLSADFNLKGDLHKIKSSGFLKLNKVSFNASGIDINNVNADVDLSNNNINISNAVGYVNNAPIMLSGTINKNINLEIIMNKVQLNYICPKSWGVESGIASLVAKVSGTLDNVIHKENINIDNFKYTNKNGSLSFNSLKIDTNKDNVAYISNILVNNQYTELIKIPLLKLYIDPDRIEIPNTNIFMANSKIVSKADISNYNNKNLLYNVCLNGNIHSRDLKFIKNNFSTYPINLSLSGDLKNQNIIAQMLMEKATIFDEPTLVNLMAKSDYNNIKIDDLSLYSFKGLFENDFKANLKGVKKATVLGNIENIKDPIFKNFRILIPQQLSINYLDSIAQVKGDIFLNGKIKSPEIVGELTIQNFINQFLQLSVNNMSVDFNKAVAIINAPVIKLGESVLGINSTVSTNFSSGLVVKNINIKSKYLSTDTLLMYKDVPLFNILPLVIKEGKFYSEKVIASIYNSTLPLVALSMDFNLHDNNLYIKNMSSDLFNGKLAGSINFNLKDENFASKIQARGVSASPIFDIISLRKDSVSGVMDFDTNLHGNLTNKQSLNGNLKFIVHNGRMGTLGKLEHLLYAQNVIADNMLRTSLSVVTKAIVLKDTGLFKYLRGDIDLINGIANVKMLQSQGPLMSLFIKGSYNPQTDYGQFAVLGRLSDEIISGLGAFGDFSFNKLMVMLTGEENKYDILPEDYELLPQLPMKNTKEFRSIINGIIDKPSSVVLFNWISYSKKSYRQKDVTYTDVTVPEFVDNLPY